MTDKLLESFQNMTDLVIAAAPRVVMGIGLLILALIVAKVIEKVLALLLRRLKFDSLLGRVGVDKTLQRIGIRQRLDQFLPRLVYFLLLFLFVKTAADALELHAISDAIGAFFGYLPNIIAALLLVIIGTTAGQFVGQTVTRAARESGIEFADALGRMVSSLILFMVGLMAISQLKIDTDIVRLVTSILLAGLAIAFALSFGLGSRDVIRNIVAGFYARRVLKIGEQLEIAGQRGVLRAITSTHTVIEGTDATVTISNSAFLDQVARQ